jgi:fimbrial chaperone protein
MSTRHASPVGHFMPTGLAGFSILFRFEYLILLLLVWIPSLTHAGSFSVTPLRIELSKSETTRVINLQNLEDKPVTVQLQVMAWSHKDGKDQFTPTRDVIVTPQVFHLKANGLQIIRAGLLRKPDANDELAYRLFIEEIPAPPPADFKGAQLALKITLPVFISPEKTPSPKLEFQTAVEPDGRLKVKIVNRGQAHAQIQQMTVFAKDKSEKSLAIYEKSLYVLPGQERHLLLKTDARDLAGIDKFFISATTRHGPIESHASPGPP